MYIPGTRLPKNENFPLYSGTTMAGENRKSQFDPTTAPKVPSTNSDPKLVAPTAF
jgi:hypothetical protein